MSADGTIEREAIMTQLSTLAGGRVDEGTQDDDGHLRYPDADVKPYIVVIFNYPFPVPGSKGMADGDADTPHLMTFTVTVYAPDAKTAQRGGVSVRGKMSDFEPSSTSSPIGGIGGVATTNSDGRKKPSRWGQASHWGTIINLGP
jgi:hypothetical protein